MQLLSVKEIQSTLRIGRDKAYSLVHAKAFPAIKIGGRFYVEAEALEEWVRKYRYKEFKL